MVDHQKIDRLACILKKKKIKWLAANSGPLQSRSVGLASYKRENKKWLAASSGPLESRSTSLALKEKEKNGRPPESRLVGLA